MDESQMPTSEQIARMIGRMGEIIGQAISDYFERNRPAIEAIARLAADPKVQQAIERLEAQRAIREYRPCHCLCGHSHPDDKGVCDMQAVTTRRYVTGAFGTVDVQICAPCAVAQGLSELPASGRS